MEDQRGSGLSLRWKQQHQDKTSAGSYLDQPFVTVERSPVRPPVHLPSACWTAMGGLPFFSLSLTLPFAFGQATLFTEMLVSRKVLFLILLINSIIPLRILFWKFAIKSRTEVIKLLLVAQPFLLILIKHIGSWDWTWTSRRHKFSFCWRQTTLLSLQ